MLKRLWRIEMCRKSQPRLLMMKAGALLAALPGMQDVPKRHGPYQAPKTKTGCQPK